MGVAPPYFRFFHTFQQGRTMVIFESRHSEFTVEMCEYRKVLVVMFGDEHPVTAEGFYQLAEFFSANPDLLEKWKRDSL